MAQLIIDHNNHTNHQQLIIQNNINDILTDNDDDDEDDDININDKNSNNDNDNNNNNNDLMMVAQIDQSYHDESFGVFGCKHYARNCFLKSECCNKWYVCRFCHDEQNEDLSQQSNTNNGSFNNNNNHNKNADYPHQINRYSTKQIKCMKCGTIQIASKYCISCDQDKNDNDNKNNDNDNPSSSSSVTNRYRLARYFCNVCKFYDNKTGKEIFHCDECGLCRLGKKADYIHCQRCGCCLNYKYYAKHPCIENSLKSDCPICFTYLFKSRDPVTFFMPCGHALHYDCLMQYAKSGNWKCPICRTAWYDEESEKRKKIVQAIKLHHNERQNDDDDENENDH